MQGNFLVPGLWREEKWRIGSYRQRQQLDCIILKRSLSSKVLVCSGRTAQQLTAIGLEIDTKQVRIKDQTARSSRDSGADKFQDLGASHATISALAAIGIQRPSYIQSASLKAFARQQGNLLLADHAGSGKTLAYLIPVMEHLRRHEMVTGSRYAQPHAPACIVLAPTQELCAQVRSVAKSLVTHDMRLSVKLMTGGAKGKLATQKEALRAGPDVVIGTPGRICDLLKMKALSMTCCQALVLDEVDVMLSEASLYRDQIAPILDRIPATSRALLVTASLPSATWWDLQSRFPGLTPVLGPGLHRPAPGSLEQLIDCSGGEEINEDTAFKRKAAAMLKVIQDQPTMRTIVFCNKLETCRRVENMLRRNMKDANTVIPFHDAIEDRQRQKNLQVFFQGTQDKRILVSTDRLSRGMDTEMVGHVVLFDFPRDPSEYLRRAGRTARGLKGKGTVSMLVLGRQVMLAKKILERNEAGQPLHSVSAPTS